MLLEPDQKTRQRKNVSAVALSVEISFLWRLWELPFVLFSVVKKNATQSTVMRVNNKRKHTNQVRANASKCILSHTFFDTRLHENGACVLRVRRPLISDLYCKYPSIFLKSNEGYYIYYMCILQIFSARCDIY